MPDPTPDPAPENGTAPEVRTIQVGALARVEDEGKLTIRVRDGRLEEVELRIFEAPRFFEALLRGRSLHEAPDITARICGICPVAYQMSSCHALEQLLGIEVPAAIRDLRRLLYCGEWIESHTLHIFLLHAPDFFGFESAIAMAQARPEYAELVRNSLQLKKAGNAIVSLLGGREIHPINVRVGGFYRAPSKEELRPLAGQLRSVRDFARETVRWTAALDFPPADRDYEFVALRHETEYPMNEGRLASSRGLDAPMSEFTDHFEEYQAPHSHALQARRKGGGAYFVGPLARWNLNADRAGDALRGAADETGIAWPCRNPHMSIVARSLEVLYAVDEALRIIERYEPPEQPAVSAPPRAGEGAWITEAPRGILYHRYETDAEGRIVHADIVPPTGQNQRQMEEDLLELLPGVLDRDDEEVAWQCERLVRSYDPCISCATHFLKVKVERL
jgi:sulfhydrogenase subunit alpha